jgi:acyl dehydratase
MRTITGLDELRAAAGDTLGTSEWHNVTQKDIDAFADVTGDHQWIHVDPERAKDTPFGGTIAHGYYTLSLAPRFTEQVLSLDGFAFAINYGLNKVRFPAPLPVGGRVRMSARAATSPSASPRRSPASTRASRLALKARRRRRRSRGRCRRGLPRRCSARRDARSST